MNTHKTVRTLLFTFLLASAPHAVHAASTVSTIVRFGAGISCLGGSITIKRLLEQNGCLKKWSSTLNISEEDLGTIAEGTSVLAGFSILPFDGNVNKICRRILLRIPCYALIANLTSSKTFNNAVQKVPVLGKHFGACSNIECEGSCNNCKLRKALLNATIFYMTFEYLFEYLENPHLEVALAQGNANEAQAPRLAAQSWLGKALGIIRN